MTTPIWCQLVIPSSDQTNLAVTSSHTQVGYTSSGCTNLEVICSDQNHQVVTSSDHSNLIITSSDSNNVVFTSSDYNNLAVTSSTQPP